MNGGGDERTCTYLILVEIGLFHFSQGVFQVAKHEFLNLVVVCGPYFLELHTKTDVLACAMIKKKKKKIPPIKHVQTSQR